jgi:hypothetical protein
MRKILVAVLIGAPAAAATVAIVVTGEWLVLLAGLALAATAIWVFRLVTNKDTT